MKFSGLGLVQEFSSVTVEHPT